MKHLSFGELKRTIGLWSCLCKVTQESPAQYGQVQPWAEVPVPGAVVEPWLVPVQHILEASCFEDISLTESHF